VSIAARSMPPASAASALAEARAQRATWMS